jgi:hypothetical protein
MTSMDGNKERNNGEDGSIWSPQMAQIGADYFLQICRLERGTGFTWQVKQ